MNGRINLLLATLVVSLAGGVTSTVGQTTKKVTIGDTPSTLEVRQVINVEVIPSTRNELVVEASDKTAFEQFKYYREGDALVLGREDMRRHKNNNEIGNIFVKLYVEDVHALRSLEVYGASRVSISGAAEVIDAEVYGASSLSLKGNSSRLDAEVYGASKVEFTGNCRDMDVEVYGASKLKLDGDVSNRLTAEVWGASNVIFKGTAEEAEIEVLGASSFLGQGGLAKKAWLEAYGLSKITLPCTELLSSETAGLSKIRHKRRR